MANSVADFQRQLVELGEAIRNEVQERLEDVAISGVRMLVETTDNVDAVDTGAYRASHTVMQSGRFVYESPNRVGDDEVLESAKRRGQPPYIDPPDPGDVEEQVRGNLDIDDFTFRNGRFYADILESDRDIYAITEDVLGNEAGVIAARDWSPQNRAKAR